MRLPVPPVSGMDLEVIAVGTELLRGHTIDTNTAELAATLGEVGISVARCTTVADDQSQIESTLKDALRRTGLVVLTGGLGPTPDDVTREAVAEVFGVELAVNEEHLERLKSWFADRSGRAMPHSNAKQCEVPLGAELLSNQQGSAPGIWMKGEDGIAILLPGVPHEMKHILHAQVIPRLRDRLLTSDGYVAVSKSLTLRTTAVSESLLADLLAGVESDIAPVTLSYLPTVFGVELCLTALRMPPENAVQVLAAAESTLRERIGKWVYGTGDDDLAAVLLDRLRDRGARLAVAESCTGGLVGARITSVPGSSDVFKGSLVAYDDSVKISQLGVAESSIREYGAVSEEVVLEMAEGVSRRLETDAAIAVTGIAGPSGGSPEKPVGTVYLAAVLNGQTMTSRKIFPGEREWVRNRSAQDALALLWELALR